MILNAESTQPLITCANLDIATTTLTQVVGTFRSQEVGFRFHQTWTWSALAASRDRRTNWAPLVVLIANFEIPFILRLLRCSCRNRNSRKNLRLVVSNCRVKIKIPRTHYMRRFLGQPTVAPAFSGLNATGIRWRLVTARCSGPLSSGGVTRRRQKRKLRICVGFIVRRRLGSSAWFRQTT